MNKRKMKKELKKKEQQLELKWKLLQDKENSINQALQVKEEIIETLGRELSRETRKAKMLTKSTDSYKRKYKELEERTAKERTETYILTVLFIITLFATVVLRWL